MLQREFPVRFAGTARKQLKSRHFQHQIHARVHNAVQVPERTAGIDEMLQDGSTAHHIAAADIFCRHRVEKAATHSACGKRGKTPACALRRGIYPDQSYAGKTFSQFSQQIAASAANIGKSPDTLPAQPVQKRVGKVRMDSLHFL